MHHKPIRQRRQQQQLLPHLPTVDARAFEAQLAFAVAPDQLSPLADVKFGMTHDIHDRRSIAILSVLSAVDDAIDVDDRLSRVIIHQIERGPAAGEEARLLNRISCRQASVVVLYWQHKTHSPPTSLCGPCVDLWLCPAPARSPCSHSPSKVCVIIRRLSRPSWVSALTSFGS